MSQPLSSLIDRLWYGRSPLALALLPLSWLFGAVVWCRRKAFAFRLFQGRSLRLPVIVVGNICVGGAGKTPVVAWLAGELVRRGLRVGIVSRGYGGAETPVPRQVALTDTAALVGDEPLMLAHKTGCPVVVCTRRVLAVEHLYGQSVDVVVADDGLQHYAMGRVAELIVIDGERGLGNGRLMPAGPLRESAARLDTVDAVLVNGPSTWSGLEFRLDQQAARAVNAELVCQLEEFAGRRVWSVAGIGNPQRFHAALRAQGIRVDEVAVPDHGQVDLYRLRAQRQQPVLMTEKDAVKYAEAPEDCWFVPVELRFAEPESVVTELLDRLEARITAFNREGQP